MIQRVETISTPSDWKIKKKTKKKYFEIVRKRIFFFCVKKIIHEIFYQSRFNIPIIVIIQISPLHKIDIFRVFREEKKNHF